MRVFSNPDTVARVEGLIFDLDGTLVDTAPGIERCLRQALIEVAPGVMPPVTADLIGPPVRDMVGCLMPEADEAVLDAGVLAFRRCYDGDGWRDAVPYAGTSEMLVAMRSAGRRLFIVTNKPRVPTDRIMEHLEWRDLFDGVICRNDTVPEFADKAAALAHLVMLESLDVTRMLFVGDTADDAEAARTCGVRFAFAGYGYGAVATLPWATIDSPTALLTLLDRGKG